MKTLLLTGANKGIGLAVIQNLAKKPNWKIIMACRNTRLAQKALTDLKRKYPHTPIEVGQVDLMQQQSIQGFVQHLKERNTKLDVVVNNAGVFEKTQSLTVPLAKTTLQTNLYGTISFTERVLPLINNRGKIITVASTLGKYKMVPNSSIAETFKDPDIDKQKLYGLVKKFQESVSRGTYKQDGYPSAYIISKLAINIYATRILPKQKAVIDKEIQVYSQCPGYVATDMTDFKGYLPPEKGALTTVYLAELPFQVNPEYQGKFFEKCKVSSL